MSKDNDKHRVTITGAEAQLIAAASFQEARDKLGIPEDVGVSRGQWVDAIPLVKRALELSDGYTRKQKPRAKAKKANLVTTDGPRSDVEPQEPTRPAPIEDRGNGALDSEPASD